MFARTETGNSVKQTSPVLRLKTRAHLPERKKKKTIVFFFGINNLLARAKGTLDD